MWNANAEQVKGKEQTKTNNNDAQIKIPNSKFSPGEKWITIYQTLLEIST